MRLERHSEDGAAGTAYQACLREDSTPVQVIITNGQRQFLTKGAVVEISVSSLFQPAWSEIRAGLRAKLQATTAVYADSETVVRHLLGPDVLECAWTSRTNGGDMSDPVVVSGEPSKASSRPARKSFFSKRWSINRS